MGRESPGRRSFALRAGAAHDPFLSESGLSTETDELLLLRGRTCWRRGDIVNVMIAFLYARFMLATTSSTLSAGPAYST